MSMRKNKIASVMCNVNANMIKVCEILRNEVDCMLHSVKNTFRTTNTVLGQVLHHYFELDLSTCLLCKIKLDTFKFN